MASKSKRPSGTPGKGPARAPKRRPAGIRRVLAPGAREGSISESPDEGRGPKFVDEGPPSRQ